MELKDHIDKRIWDRIKSKYENKQYSDAIKSTIYYLNKLIQDRSFLTTDNTDLVNRAFKTNNPIIKITKNKTRVEKDIQDGFKHLLLGIFKSFRNPIAHEEIKYSKENAVSIILFINYLCSILDESETSFNENQFLKRLSDEAYVATDEYSKLLVEEIPKKKLYDIAIYILRNRLNYNLDNISSFSKQLMNILDQKSRIEILQNISDELRDANEDAQIETIFSMYNFDEFWNKIKKISRIRTENYLLTSLKKGSMGYHLGLIDDFSENIDYDIGELAKKILPGKINKFENRLEIYNVLYQKLTSSDTNLSGYVDSTFFEDIIDIGLQFESKDFHFSTILHVITKNKDISFIALFLEKLDEHPKKELILKFYNEHILQFRNIIKEYNETVPF